MRLSNITDNGNVVVNSNTISSRDISIRSYFHSDDQNIITNSNLDDNVQFNSNYNRFSTEILNIDSKIILEESRLCNEQYKLNQKVESISIFNDNNKLNVNRPTDTTWQKNRLYNAKDTTGSTPAEEERAFDLSDSDEMSEKGVHPVPRGIVNPNYPGFQHLAHTLQEYTSNIGSSYHSENEMTDDDLDIEISDSTSFYANGNHIQEDLKNINNNKNHETTKLTKINNTSLSEIDKCNVTSRKDDIPDLLKTISQNNNNNIDSINYDLNCSDIENNFHTKDIIGDFNKEIEDEIRQLLNYNITIEDDLEELRKDIKETFAKPIENTINNISEVVNHVIKKLVESDGSGKCDVESSDHINDHEMQDITDIDKENETNTRTEMNISRPTFLLIDSNVDKKIKDAILSDGKDEINIYEEEYDTEQLSHNVENTIKQLSTELRKIIPKLNEMRERDKLWIENKKEIITDKNFNNIRIAPVNCISQNRTCVQLDSLQKNVQDCFMSTNNQHPIKTLVEPKIRHSITKEIPNAHNIAYAPKNDIHKESDFETFDVYNIETALPKLDLDAIENHLRAAKEAERRVCKDFSTT